MGGGDLSFCGKLEFHPVFPFSLAPHALAAYIFTTAPTCKATIISLEPCALNADFFNISFPDLIKKLFHALQVHDYYFCLER